MKRIYNNSQARALRNIVRRIQDCIYSPEVEVISELKFKRIGAALISVTFRTRRNDCDWGSPRAVLCESQGHLIVGPRGRIQVGSWSKGLHDSSEHEAAMLGGTKL